MIKYSLICGEKHRFESWFASAEAFETLSASAMLSCAICGDTHVEKAIMAPNVKPSGEKTGSEKPAPAPVPQVDHPLMTPSSPVEKALTDLKRKIEANSDYVGGDFAREARAIHTGDAPERSIHGEANAKDARDLVEDGIPVLPLPFSSRRKTN